MKTKKRDLLNRYIPLWSIVPLVTIMAVNCLIYWGSSALTAGRYHFDFTMAFDREVPLLPVFVWFYILAFPFWAVGYLLAARRGKDMFYRFVATDLTIHFICFICFIDRSSCKWSAMVRWSLSTILLPMCAIVFG